MKLNWLYNALLLLGVTSLANAMAFGNATNVSLFPDDGIIELFSNAASGRPDGVGARNSPANFTNKLPQPYAMKNLEVAVQSVLVPRSWVSMGAAVNKKMCMLVSLVDFSPSAVSHVTPQDSSEALLDNTGQRMYSHIQITLPNLRYKSVQHVLDTMVVELKRRFPTSDGQNAELFRITTQIGYQGSVSLYVQDVPNSESTVVTISWELAEFIGFDKPATRFNYPDWEFVLNRNSYNMMLIMLGDFDPKLHLRVNIRNGPMRWVDLKNSWSSSQGRDPVVKPGLDLNGELRWPTSSTTFQQMFVYSNMVKPRFVGSGLHPLLTTIPNVKGDDVGLLYTPYNPVYVPVEEKQVELIDITILDDNGRPIPFTWGSTAVRLHIRARKSGL